jgi:hypothetical protein
VPKTGVWPVAVVLATACCVSACGTASTATTASTSSSAHASPGTPASQGQSAADTSNSTPGAALTNWIHAVAAGNRSGACKDMAARSSEMTTCMSSAATDTFTSLHGNFVTDGIKSGTPIQVTGSHITGTTATISGSDVCVSDTMLNTLMADHSTGIKPGQLRLSFDLSRVDGAWYVTNFNMDVG